MIAMLRHNLSLKLIAFILALTAWGFTRVVDPIEEWQMIMEADVRLSQGSSLVSRFPPDPSVIVYATGPVSRLERLQASNMKVILDGRGIPPGETRAVQPRLERRFTGVQTTFIPSTFDLSMDRLVRKDFAPEEVGEGSLPKGYFIEERIGVPTTVTVEGAATLVDRVKRVIYYLVLTDLSGSTELSVEFDPIDKNGAVVRNLSLTPGSSDIALSVRPSQAMKTVPIVVDYQGTPASNYALTSLSSNPFMVDVTGPEGALAGIMSVRTSPISLTGKTSSFEQSVSLLSPGQGVALSTTHATVHVDIEQIDSTFTFENLPIEKRGTNSAYSYELSVEQVEVTIRGGPARVAQVTADLVRPQVDLSGLGPGAHEVQVSVALPTGVRRDAVSPSSVTVTISEKGAPDAGSGGNTGEQPAGDGSGDNAPG